MQRVNTTVDAASVAATAALESRTPWRTAALATVRAAARFVPVVPSMWESFTLTVTAELPTIKPGASILTFSMSIVLLAGISDRTENPVNLTLDAVPKPLIVTLPTLAVRGSVYSPGYTKIVSPSLSIVVGIDRMSLNWASSVSSGLTRWIWLFAIVFSFKLIYL